MTIAHEQLPPLQSLAFALIIDGTGQVLLVRHNYNGNYYALPGGAVESGELPQEAAVREIHEELCVEARVTRLLSLFSFVADGRFQAHVFLAEIISGTPMHPALTRLPRSGGSIPTSCRSQSIARWNMPLQTHDAATMACCGRFRRLIE